MKILHTSDLHGNLQKILNLNVDFDIWIDSGDFFPNFDPCGPVDDFESERQYEWLFGFSKQIAEFLSGRPFAYISGNHDYCQIDSVIQSANNLSREFVFDGITFHGFRHIKVIKGFWVGEIYEFDSDSILESISKETNVLVTHSPAAGIFDTKYASGFNSITNHLMYREHKIKAHLCGHIHETYGQKTERNIIFSNAARAYNLLSI